MSPCVRIYFEGQVFYVLIRVRIASTPGIGTLVSFVPASAAIEFLLAIESLGYKEANEDSGSSFSL